jgi:hypothetical protein
MGSYTVTFVVIRCHPLGANIASSTDAHGASGLGLDAQREAIAFTWNTTRVRGRAAMRQTDAALGSPAR